MEQELSIFLARRKFGVLVAFFDFIHGRYYYTQYYSLRAFELLSKKENSSIELSPLLFWLPRRETRLHMSYVYSFECERSLQNID